DADTVLVVREMPTERAVRIARKLGVSVLQMHGNYSEQDFRYATRHFPRVWRATSLTHSPDLEAGEFGEELVLLDGTRAGSGERWDLAQIDRCRLGERW